ncbi:rRNA maturation RNase YbeY [Flavobacteriaceae bacterium D16]|nr:rRNA maturation RNase YbeY [Flavobacteriaceae bacterium D16]
MIEFCFETSFKVDQEHRVKTWLEKVVNQEGSIIDQLVYVFCKDEKLLELNKKFLNHDTYTDILTFPYGTSAGIHADICISIPRVKENAKKYGVDEQEELRRVMVHGVLHLLGYNDHSKEDKQAMRQLEEDKLKMFHVEQ